MVIVKNKGMLKVAVRGRSGFEKIDHQEHIDCFSERYFSFQKNLEQDLYFSCDYFKFLLNKSFHILT